MARFLKEANWKLFLTTIFKSLLHFLETSIILWRKSFTVDILVDLLSRKTVCTLARTNAILTAVTFGINLVVTRVSMMPKSLEEYFLNGADRSSSLDRVGMEVETMFVDTNGTPISLECSKRMLELLSKSGWSISQKKGSIITELKKGGNKILYELSRANIELAVEPSIESCIVGKARNLLQEIYAAGNSVGAEPFFGPVLEVDDPAELLVIPDERDAIWLELDGRAALGNLARCSAVQFVFDVDPNDAIVVLNRLGSVIDHFLEDYPQQALWKKYIRESRAGYLPLRYGGPLIFKDFGDYCNELVKHAVVLDGKLVPPSDAGDFDIPLFLRSIWWYFRLRRYGSRLCIEVRPLPRREDEKFREQLESVLDIIE